MDERTVLIAIEGAALGLALGASCFLALRANTRLYFGPSVGPALALHAARLVFVTAGFLLIALFLPKGVAPALLGFTAAGFFTSRRAATARTP